LRTAQHSLSPFLSPFTTQQEALGGSLLPPNRNTTGIQQEYNPIPVCFLVGEGMKLQVFDCF
jgi:hypothetical protein